MSEPFGPEAASHDPFRSPAPAAASARRKSWLWLLVGGSLAGFCLCGGLCVVPAGLGVYYAFSQRGDAEQVLNAFLKEADAGEMDSALTLFSARARTNGLVSHEQIENLTQSDYGRGCLTAHVTQINVGKFYNSDKKTAQGTVANVSGSTTYRDGTSGTFRATLEKQTEGWRIHSLQLSRPAPSRPATDNDERRKDETPESQTLNP
jgi:hypothetical protein